MTERMLKFGKCSSIRVLNTQSLSYHSIASSNVNKILVEDDVEGELETKYAETFVAMKNDGGDGSSSSSLSSLIDSSVSIGASTGIIIQLPEQPLLIPKGCENFHRYKNHPKNPINMINNSNSNNNNNNNNNNSIGSSSGSSLGISIALNSSNNSSSNNTNNNNNNSNNYSATNSSLDGASNSLSPPSPVFKSSCFHPTQPILFVSIRNEVYFYDLLNQSFEVKMTIDPLESIEWLLVVSFSSQLHYLVAYTKEGLIYLWDIDSYKLVTIVHPLKLIDPRVVTCRVVCPYHAIMYYSKENSKDVIALDFRKGYTPFKIKGHKKPISALAHHPTKPYLASVSNDGSLKIWDTRSPMATYNLEDYISYENSRNIEHSNSHFLAFEPTVGKYMIMIGASGLTLVFGDFSIGYELNAVGFVCKGHNILSVVHHPQLPVFFVLSVNPASGVEELSSWEINYQMKSIIASTLMAGVFMPSNDDIFGYLPEYSKPLSTPLMTATNVLFHPIRNLVTFQWESLNHQHLSGIRHINQYIYSVNPFDNIQRASLPLISTIPLPLGFFLSPENEHTFSYPPEIIYFDGSFVRAYVPLNGITRKLIEAPVISPSADELCRAKCFSYNSELQLVSLIYDSYSISTQTLLSKYLLIDVAGSVSQQGDGIDSVMIGNNSILILGLDGRIAKVASLSHQGVSAFKNHQLAPKVAAVFKTPLNDGRVVQYYCQEKNCILFSKNINPADKDNYSIDQSLQLYLYKIEKVYKIEWQTDLIKKIHICAIMTDMRIIITNEKMEIINQTQVPPAHRNTSCYFSSMFWLEWTLMYATPTHLMYITLQNNLPPRPIVSLSLGPIVMSTVLPDRVLYAYQGCGIGASAAKSVGLTSNVTSPAMDNNTASNGYINNQTVVHALSIGLLECLVVGLLSVPSWLAGDKKQTLVYLDNLVSRFEYSRASRFMLDKLRERGYSDLCYSLANKMHTCQSKLSSLDKFRMAWSSKQYEDAHRHLIAEYNKQLATPKLMMGNTQSTITASTEKRAIEKLKDLMRDFGRECMNAGHYHLARECFIRLTEYIYLLQISVLMGDIESVKTIRKAAEGRGDAVLVSACDGFLKQTTAGPSEKLNPPVIKILPWSPTSSINVGIKAGNDYLSPINLNNIHRYFPIPDMFSNTASSYGSQRHKLRSPDEKWPPEDYKHNVALSPPRTLMSLVANRLSTKSHISSTHTLRRSPSAENVTLVSGSTGGVGKMIGASTMDYDDYDSDSESGADADVDSDAEEDIRAINRNLEELKVNNTTTSDSQSIDDLDDDSSTMDSSTNISTPLSSTPTTDTLISNLNDK